MASDWFNVPETGADTENDPLRPDYVASIAGINGYAGRRLADKAPRFTVHVFGTDAALTDLEGKTSVARIDAAKVEDRMGQATGQNRSAAEWAERFRAE